jgi:hypothetical protein
MTRQQLPPQIKKIEVLHRKSGKRLSDNGLQLMRV